MNQPNNIEKWLIRVTFLTFALLTMAVLLTSRKPICLDSSAIDKLEYGKESFVYRCAASKNAPFSGYLYKNLEDIQSSLLIEKYLQTLSPFSSKMKIKIWPKSENYYRWSGPTLNISENVFETSGVIEKSIVKFWLRQQNPTFFQVDLLTEEVFADFIVATFHGKMKIENPFAKNKSHTAVQNWSQVVKTVTGYCQSSWKMSEHLQMCNNLKKADMAIGQEIIEFSLRPLLSSLWVDFYKGLSLKQQYEMVQALPQIVRDLTVHEDFYLESLQSSKSNPWLGPYLIVQRMNQIWNQSSSYLSVSTYRQLLAQMAFELEKRGFQKIININEFDLVYLSDERLDMKSPKISSLVELAKKNQNLRILLRDPDKVWFLPSKMAISNQVLNQIHSNKTVLETCHKIDFSRVIAFSAMTERLMVIRNCDPKKIHQFQNFISQGAEGFAIQNQKTSFVQFHLPSVLLKKESLSKAGDIFRFIIQRPIDSPSFQSLGWQAIDWNDKLKTYHPRGYVDAIELFRISPQDNSNNISNL